MDHIDFTQYDSKPRSQVAYLRNFGPHFNKALCDFATSNMYLDDDEEDPIEPFTKDQVDMILANNNIKLEKNRLYDYVFVACMARADFMGPAGCLQTEDQLAKYIKNVIDDPDAQEGVLFARWLATMAVNGVPIDWAEIMRRS